MNYSLADSLRFVRHLTTSDLDTDNVDLLHVIGEHLENLRNSGDESAKELLKEKAQSLGEWVDLNPERTFDFKLEKDEEEHKALLEERRYVRRQIEAIDRQNNEAYLMEREVRLERENNTVINRQNDIARQELVRQCAVVLAQLEVESKKFLDFVKSGEAQKVVEKVEAHLGKGVAEQLQVSFNMGKTILYSGMGDYLNKQINNPNNTPAETKELIDVANGLSKYFVAIQNMSRQDHPNPNDVNTANKGINKYVLYFFVNKEKFEKDPDTHSFYNAPIYKKFENEYAIIAQKMGAPDIHSKEFREWLSNKDNENMFLKAKLDSGLTIESSLNIAEIGVNKKKDIESVREAVNSLKIKVDSGVITGYAEMLNEVQTKVSPMILKQVALSVTEDALLNKEHVDKEKFSVLQIESPAHSGKFIEMQVYTNEPNSTEASRKVFSAVADKYLKKALDPEFLGLSRNGKAYLSFVNSYLSQYLSDEPTMVIVPNSNNAEKAVVNKLNAGLLKLTAVKAFINDNSDIADLINIEAMLKNENLRSQLKEGLVAQIQYSRNETPTEDYLNSVIDNLLTGKFKSTIEFYKQEYEFYEEYKIGNVNINKENVQDKEKTAELANSDDFKNISATI